MTENERFRAVREELGLSRRVLGEVLGVSGDVINNIEMNRTVHRPDALYKLLCEKFDIDEHWLMTGEGQMRVPRTRDEEIMHEMGRLLKNEDEAFRKRLISLCLQLDDQELELLKDFAVKLVEGKED